MRAGLFVLAIRQQIGFAAAFILRLYVWVDVGAHL